MTGTDKLRPWVIGKSKHSRPLSKVNLKLLPVYYQGNPKVWMNSLVFKKVFHEMNSHFKMQNKKILLLVDNIPSYFDSHYLSDSEIKQNDDDDEESSNGKFFFLVF